jgi:hypothetical protein
MAQVSVANIFNPIAARIGTLTTAGAQGTGDFVGTDHTPIIFEDCANVNGGSGHIPSAIFLDGDLQSIAAELWLFNFPITSLGHDNAAFTVSDAEMVYFIGAIPFSTYYANALNSISIGVPPALIDFKCQANSRRLYGALVTRGAPTYTTAVPYFTLNIWQD